MSRTWNGEERLCTVFHSCSVMGHAAEPSTVLQTHPCDLQNAGGQKGVPTRDGDPVRTPTIRALICTCELPGSNLSSLVSTGRLSFSQLMTGSGRPWIWHWNLAAPDSSACTDSGWTWKFAMAAEGGGRGLSVITVQLQAWLLTPHMHIYLHGVENSSPPDFYFVLYCSVNHLQGWKIALHCHTHAFINTNHQRLKRRTHTVPTSADGGPVLRGAVCAPLRNTRGRMSTRKCECK